MEKVLIVVDMQNDFVFGSLGSREAQAIIPQVAHKIDECRRKKIPIFFTRDTHYDDYFETMEGKYLPVEHCKWHTEGWNFVPGLFETGDVGVNKFTFGYLGWDVRLHNAKEIEIIGVCTDICVISNALIIRSMFRNANITVDASCCAGTTPENHRAALQVMKACHINVVGE